MLHILWLILQLSGILNKMYFHSYVSANVLSSSLLRCHLFFVSAAKLYFCSPTIIIIHHPTLSIFIL